MSYILKLTKVRCSIMNYINLKPSLRYKTYIHHQKITHSVIPQLKDKLINGSVYASIIGISMGINYVFNRHLYTHTYSYNDEHISNTNTNTNTDNDISLIKYIPVIAVLTPIMTWSLFKSTTELLKITHRNSRCLITILSAPILVVGIYTSCLAIGCTILMVCTH